MPDIVNNVQTMSLNHTKSYEEDRSSIKIETPGYNTQCSENYIQQQNDHFHYDPLMSSKQSSTVDMSAIDPIIVNYQLLSMHQKAPIINGNENAESLLNDIDMLSW